MKTILYGAFGRHNFGDMLFPHVLESFSKETVAPRSNCILDTSKIERYIKIRTAKESLEDALSKYKH